ncbi:phosphonoacetaldehyde hydrolase [Desulfogranum marinum]|uniref:phosphonoacetaldehyde hydrolase n=1 Tax=Desulfogranum marinum TaxID=453220 RepID=UPI001965FE1C|nr:phosphonoacetaldehyde hydrolase [Desulfogranum marinum]MBM9511815.1 phosphonoacetaldehyde hydrolase [Desulfogranum marinum]
MEFQYTRSYIGNVKLVVFDWAGTVVDYGCQAPIRAFVQGFKDMGVAVSMESARGPMGMEKWAHIKAVTELDEVKQAWRNVHKREVTDADIDAMFENFSKLLLDSIAAKSTLLPGVVNSIEALRSEGIKIAGSTGYFTEAADIVAECAAKEGYCPDFTTCASNVPAGRPAPWMIYQAMQELGVYPVEAVVNVGDTPVDMETALNAGVWSVGVAATGNQMGLTEEEVEALDPKAYAMRLAKARESLFKAGAHFVINTMEELPEVIDMINENLVQGCKP